jgi:hypothetical protein
MLEGWLASDTEFKKEDNPSSTERLYTLRAVIYWKILELKREKDNEPT